MATSSNLAYERLDDKAETRGADQRDDAMQEEDESEEEVEESAVTGRLPGPYELHSHGHHRQHPPPNDLLRKLGRTAAMCILCFGLALNGLAVWDAAPVFNQQPGTPYTSHQFSWFLAFMILIPFSVGLLVMLSIQISALRRDPWVATSEYSTALPAVVAATHIVLAFGAAAAAALSYHRAADILDCGILFCIGPGPKSSSYNQGPGWRNGSGTALFAISLALLVLEVRLAWLALKDLVPQTRGVALEAQPRAGERHERYEKRARRCRWLAVVLWFFIGMPLFAVAAMLFPPSFERLSSDRLRYTAAAEAKAPGTPGSPEQAGTPSIMTTKNWVIKEGEAVLKAWPDLLVFYAFIYVVSVIGMMAQLHRPLRNWLLWRPRWLRGTSVGAVGLGLAFGVALAMWTWYWRYAHSFLGTPTPGNPTTWPRERSSRTFGQIGSFILGLLVLPVSRNSIWVTVFGVSWESTIWVHIWLSYFFLACTAVHMFAWWTIYAWGGRCDPRIFYLSPDGPAPGCEGADACNATCRSGSCPLPCSSFPHDILPRGPMFYPSNSLYMGYPPEARGLDWTPPLMTYLYLLVLICMGIFAHHRVRRQQFELFWAAHWIAAPPLMAGMLLHAYSAWYYIMGGFTLFAVDHCIRSHNASLEVDVVDLTAKEHYAVLTLKTTKTAGGVGGKPLQHSAGQFVWINVPRISPFEWHPFTISSSPHHSATTIHIQPLGPSTFTGQLHTLAMEVEAGSAPLPAVLVDGVYGSPAQIHEYTSVLLVAGGIGVTPVLSLFNHLLHEAANGRTPCKMPEFRVRMVWSTRDVGSLDLAAESIQGAASDPRFAVSLHATRGNNPTHEGGVRERLLSEDPETVLAEALADTTTLIEGVDGCLHYGRPNIKSQLDEVGSNGSSTLIFACGPEALVESCGRLAFEEGVHFRKEVFLL